MHFYTDVAPHFNQPCVPRCYGAGFDTRARRFTLVLEDLSTTHFQTEWPIPPPRLYCRMAIACLAQVHAYWWNHRDLPQVTGTPASQQKVAARIRALQDKGDAFVAFLGDRLTERRKAVLTLWPSRWGE